MMEVEFYGESDRAAILLSATLAALAIEVSLKRLLCDDKSTLDLFDHEAPLWPAPGSEDTELGVLMELEVGHGETEVYPRVQA